MPHFSEATRQIMWNVPAAWAIYPLFIFALASLGYGLYRHISCWRQGKEDSDRLESYGARLGFTVREVLLQARVRRGSIAGVFHSLFFYSFIVFVITTAVIALDWDFGTTLFNGRIYIVLTVLSDLAGLLFLVGLAIAVWRRAVLKPDYLESDSRDTFTLGMLFVIILTGFMIEGLRIAVAGDLWSRYSPVGLLTAGLFGGIPETAGKNLHAAIWWVHTLCVMAWIGTIPYTRFVHLLFIPVNIFFRKTRPAGELMRMDLEAMMEDEDFDPDNFSIGLNTTADLTWKQRLNLDACISCGRCEAVCPAHSVGYPLSPKQFIAGMKTVMDKDNAVRSDDETFQPAEIVENAFDETFGWHCRTCRACDEVCPAFVEHVDNQIDIRRSEVNMKGRMPEELEAMLRQMETSGNPFGHQTERVKWAESLDVRIIEPGESCDVLYWVGCLSTFDPVKRGIAEGVINYLKQSGVDFGILGSGEQCCGDPARVAGEENLFQMTAKQQVEELNSRKFNILLTACPHCYNVLKNEYPQFGGKYTVMHHTEYLAGQRASGIRPSEPGGTVAFHDPCYLGRFQGIYDAPRQVLERIPGINMVRPEQSGWQSFCCGAGGGHFWMDFKADERINNLRVQQFNAAGVDTIVTACPFCHHMLEDAVKLLNLEDDIQVRDIIEFQVPGD
jgi:Fe-S oxidoreductase/nitrate reductase gamma subunit